MHTGSWYNSNFVLHENGHAYHDNTVIKLVALSFCYCKNLHFSGLKKHPSRDQGMQTKAIKKYYTKLDCKTPFQTGLMSSKPNKLCHEIATFPLKQTG